MKSLSIITNERIYFNNSKNKFYAENIDCKSIIDGLNFFFRITLYARFSKEKKNNLINANSVLICKNFFLLKIIKEKNNLNIDDKNLLIVILYAVKIPKCLWL